MKHRTIQERLAIGLQLRPLYESGLSIEGLARRFPQWSWSTIQRCLVAADTKMRGKGHDPRVYQEMLRLFEQGMLHREIARALHISEKHIQRKLAEAGYRRRSL